MDLFQLHEWKGHAKLGALCSPLYRGKEPVLHMKCDLVTNERYGPEAHVVPSEVRTLLGGQLESSAQQPALEATQGEDLQGGNWGDREGRGAEHQDEQQNRSTNRDQRRCEEHGWEEKAVTTETPVSKTRQNGYVKEGWRREFEVVFLS